MNFFTRTILTTILGLCSLVQAIELAELRLPMTRDEADNLSKDYDYEVLSDLSVRRTWRVDGRRISIDFDSKNDQAVSIIVSYVEPIARKMGLEDAKILAGDKVDKPKWKTLKKEAAEKFGMENAEALQLSDGSYLFREVTADKKKRFTRLSLFAQMPKENRFELTVLDASGGKTALGSATVGSGIKELYADEARRMGAAGKTAVAVAAVSSTDAEPSADVTPAITALGSTPGARRTSSQESSSQVVAAQSSASNVSSPSKTAEAKPMAERSLAEALGLDNPGPVQYGVIGGIVLILLLVVVMRANAAKRKAAQKAKYTAVLLNNKKSSAPKISRR